MTSKYLLFIGVIRNKADRTINEQITNVITYFHGYYILDRKDK